MKKILLLLTVFACFSFTFSDVNKKSKIEKETLLNTCPPNSSSISSSCWSGCVTMVPVALGNCLECDVAAMNAGPRKPTLLEFEEAQEILDEFCNS